MLILVVYEFDFIGIVIVLIWSGVLFGDGYGGIVLRLVFE